MTRMGNPPSVPARRYLGRRLGMSDGKGTSGGRKEREERDVDKSGRTRRECRGAYLQLRPELERTGPPRRLSLGMNSPARTQGGEGEPRLGEGRGWRAGIHSVVFAREFHPQMVGPVACGHQRERVRVSVKNQEGGDEGIGERRRAGDDLRVRIARRMFRRALRTILCARSPHLTRILDGVGKRENVCCRRPHHPASDHNARMLPQRARIQAASRDEAPVLQCSSRTPLWPARLRLWCTEDCMCTLTLSAHASSYAGTVDSDGVWDGLQCLRLREGRDGIAMDATGGGWGAVGGVQHVPGADVVLHLAADLSEHSRPSALLPFWSRKRRDGRSPRGSARPSDEEDRDAVRDDFWAAGATVHGRWWMPTYHPRDRLSGSVRAVPRSEVGNGKLGANECEVYKSSGKNDSCPAPCYRVNQLENAGCPTDIE
ncbi:hypothetical protein B0H14DRAFT_2610727 [Mycena olivaceomarginata]|nr:hypothetical protein B0H14DRAFT_2610727 [Mycena olivaceomarginata]